MSGDRTGPEPNAWAGLQAVPTLQRLNARYLEMLAEVAQTECAPVERSPIYREAELWKQIDQRASWRGGRCPVLLLDLNFERLDWWKRACGADSEALVPATGSVVLDEAQSRSLLQEVLMELWHIGRSLPRAANLLFGMAPGVSTQISALTVRELDRIAVHHAKGLRPRWEENAVFWKQLLQAAIGTDDEALFAVHLHCLQLLGSDSQLR